jgi:hemerythrin
MHYTALAWHKSQHDAVRKRAKSALTRMEKGDSAAAGELLEFLAGWLRDHMGVADRMMGAHLRNHQRFNTSLAS